MPEWLIERGIGETRALLIEADRVMAARLHVDGDLVAGSIHRGRLAETAKGTRRGTVRLASGHDVLVERVPAGTAHGSALSVLITRAAMAEATRAKPAQARVAAADMPRDDSPVFANLPNARDVTRFPDGSWEELWTDAATGQLAFAGGTLTIEPTAGMTVIDIDGHMPPRTLALAAVPVIAEAVRRFDMGGSLGIDFPTLAAKSDRKAIDTALAEELSDWPHEQTAMNGFGFVQIVARLERPSLVHRFAYDPEGMAARFLMRQGERVEGSGPVLELTANPAVAAKLTDAWLTELARRTGRTVRVAARDTVAITGGHAQIVER